MIAALLDTVGVSFPIADADTQGATCTVSGLDTPGETRTFRRKLEGGGFLAWGVGGTAWLEASLPKRVGDHNVEGIPLGEGLEVLRDAWEESLQFVELGLGRADRFGPGLDVAATGRSARSQAARSVTFEGLKVKRLDLVRDFEGVSAIGPLLDGLASVQRPGRVKTRRYADSAANLAETLRVGPKAWACTLYDKYAESGSDTAVRRWEKACQLARSEGRPAPVAPRTACEPGRLRFEFRARDRVLNSKLIKNWTGRELARVSDLDATALAVTAGNMFEHVGFDREVSGVGAVAAKINASDLTARHKRELTAYLFAAAAGVDLEWSANTERKYRQLAGHLGIVLGPANVTESFTARLDYVAGSETIAA